MKKVSVVIPAYNEEAYLGTLLRRIEKVPTEEVGYELEVIVVDDGSTDGTFAATQGFPRVRVIQQKNQGKGAAVQRGIREATGDYVLVQDADLEYDPADYVPLLRALEGRDDVAVYGSRPLGVMSRRTWSWPTPGRNPDQGLGPWGMNVTLMLLTRALYGRWVTDMLTAYKLYPMWAMREFEVKTRGFETDHELTAKLVRAGVEIREVPIAYDPRTVEEGKKIGPLDGVKAVATLARFRWFQ